MLLLPELSGHETCSELPLVDVFDPRDQSAEILEGSAVALSGLHSDYQLTTCCADRQPHKDEEDLLQLRINCLPTDLMCRDGLHDRERSGCSLNDRALAESLQSLLEACSSEAGHEWLLCRAPSTWLDDCVDGGRTARYCVYRIRSLFPIARLGRRFSIKQYCETASKPSSYRASYLIHTPDSSPYCDSR